MSAGALIVLLNLLGGWWFMQRFVLRPVNALIQRKEQTNLCDACPNLAPTTEVVM
jgi:hypothetical protein